MSLHDMMLNFSFGAQLESGETESKVIDLRYNGGLEDHLFINALASDVPGDTVTTKVMTSLTGDDDDWEEVATSANKGVILFAGRLPADLKRYVKLVYDGGEGLTVFAEITDKIDKSLDTSMVSGATEYVVPPPEESTEDDNASDPG